MDSGCGLQDWRICAYPDWVEAVQAHIGDREVPRRPDEPGSSAEVVARRLGVIGARLRDAREAWIEERYPVSAADDDVSGLWSAWGAGDPWTGQRDWISLLHKPVERAFRLALASRPPPPHVVARATGDVRDALYYQLVSGGFAELAAYVLETAPEGPVAPVYGVLSESGRALVARCVSRRGHWPRTLAQVMPAAGAAERAVLLQEGTSRPPADWIELHTALRLVDSWAQDPGDVERDWAIVSQNQGRSRGRLRAVAMLEEPSHLAREVAKLPGLVARTRAAARRWGWAWAWEEVARGFAFSIDQPVVRPCKIRAGDAPLDADALACLEGWALLAILRGRGSTVARWATEGTGDGDGTWGRLIQELPASLRDTDGGYVRVRAALAQRWPEVDEALRPLLAELGALAPGRSLKSRFWEVAGAAWHNAITKPRGGFPTLVRHAAEWVETERGSERKAGMHGGQEA